jgi:2'-5' RNA ligase
MARLRTFIAVELPKAIRDRMVALQQTLARTGTEFKWVERENLHVTLLFLGEVEDRVVPDVCRAVAGAVEELSAFPLTVAGAGCFPNPRRPRIVWVGVGQGTQELCTLHDRIEGPLLDLGCYRREERRYAPHITLGRVKSDRPTEKLTAALAKEAGWQGGETLVKEVLILSSKLTPQGPEYTVLGRAPLKG